MNFAIYNSDGSISSIGRCPDGEEANQVPIGKFLYIGVAEMHDRIDTSTGALIKGEPPEPTYRELRKTEYPPVENQLEAIWHAMNSGQIPVATEFFDMVAKVREKYPNPEAFKSVEY